ncbi:MAG: transposase [Sedimentisphaerales bacterium]|nr:transposase [Sedimentisphaerales bacterium]
MTETAVFLKDRQRQLVKTSFINTCSYRGWDLRAYSVASNHVHLVLSIPDKLPAVKCLQILKSYASLTLNQSDGITHQRWWTHGGSIRRLSQRSAIDNAISYVDDQSDDQAPDESQGSNGHNAQNAQSIRPPTIVGG